MSDQNSAPTMNPELRALWASALRCGEFPQGQGMLKSATTSLLPPKVAAALGILNQRPLFVLNDGTADERQHSFAEIADFIEATL